MSGATIPGASKRRVDGVVLLDKPAGISSNAALQRVKRAYRAQKAGHTGTLDPLATGLLPICLGEATKFAQGLLDSDKVYLTDVTLGIVTETGDAEGRVLRRETVDIDRAGLDRALAAFRGDILQVPHRYSAIKRDGRALYDYARAAEDVMVEPRPVRIIELSVEEWASPVLSLRVRCSKGTYIRSLAEDIGKALGCGAHVSKLRRVNTGRFGIENAIDLDRLETLGDPDRDARVLPVTVLVEDLCAAILTVEEAARFMHGLPARATVERSSPEGPVGGLCAIYTERGVEFESRAFLGLGRCEPGAGSPVVSPVRLLAAAGANDA